MTQIKNRQLKKGSKSMAGRSKLNQTGSKSMAGCSELAFRERHYTKNTRGSALKDLPEGLDHPKAKASKQHETTNARTRSPRTKKTTNNMPQFCKQCWNQVATNVRDHFCMYFLQTRVPKRPANRPPRRRADVRKTL